MPFATQQTGPAELVLHTRHGDIRFTWATYTRLMAEGDPGMGLEWTRTAAPYEIVKPRTDGSWESVPRLGTPLCFKGLEGSGFTFKDTWNWYTFSATAIDGYTTPGPDGTFTLAVEEFPYMVKVPKDYGTYAEGKADMLKSWEDFWAAYPKLAEPYAQKAEETAYDLWTMLVGPSALTPRWMMQMFPGVMVSQWQLVQNGVALQDIPDLSRSLLMAPLERQGEDGQLADGYDEAQLATGGIKPPIYGWALKNVMARYPEITVTVTGHTDNVGKPASNQALSQRRADNIKAMLVGKGIDESRIRAIGRGDKEPIASNQTKEGRAKNRRIEITIGK